LNRRPSLADEDQVTIRHPDIPEGKQTADGPVGVATVTRKQFETVWKERGFQEVSQKEAEKIEARSEAAAVSEGGKK
jgi:hypothetical protein